MPDMMTNPTTLRGTPRLLQATAFSGVLAFAPGAHAAWSLLDNFDSYSPGATTTATGGAWTSVFDGTANSNVATTTQGNSLQTRGGAAWRGAERDLSGTGAAIVVGETQTFYWQVMATYTTNGSGWDYDFMMGLSPSVAQIDETNAWQDFNVMPFVNNEADSPFINAAATGTYWAPMSPGVWYNVWVVVDNNATSPSYDLYYSTGTDAPVLVAQDAFWRVERTGMEVGQDLNAIGFMSAGNAGTELYIDNIHWAPGEDLTLVPEPSVAVLGSLTALALLRRRR